MFKVIKEVWNTGGPIYRQSSGSHLVVELDYISETTGHETRTYRASPNKTIQEILVPKIEEQYESHQYPK